jgi:hypothetical protein
MASKSSCIGIYTPVSRPFLPNQKPKSLLFRSDLIVLAVWESDGIIEAAKVKHFAGGWQGGAVTNPA